MPEKPLAVQRIQGKVFFSTHLAHAVCCLSSVERAFVLVAQRRLPHPFARYKPLAFQQLEDTIRNIPWWQPAYECWRQAQGARGDGATDGDASNHHGDGAKSGENEPGAKGNQQKSIGDTTICSAGQGAVDDDVSRLPGTALAKEADSVKPYTSPNTMEGLMADHNSDRCAKPSACAVGYHMGRKRRASSISNPSMPFRPSSSDPTFRISCKCSNRSLHGAHQSELAGHIARALSQRTGWIPNMRGFQLEVISS